MKYIIRDHDRKLFEFRKKNMEKIGRELTEKYSSFNGKIDVNIKDSYYNMKEKVEPFYDPVMTIPLKAMEELKIKSKLVPIRGGTDGARLSFMGLPCPNLFAGGHNFHSCFEYVPISSMEKGKSLFIKIAQMYAKKFAKF